MLLGANAPEITREVSKDPTTITPLRQPRKQNLWI